MEHLIFAWNILKAALGLGFVIFLHELGHFLLAKWNGVKVLRFSIGFGPPLLAYRKGVGLRVGTGTRPPGPGDPPTWGETEYWLAPIPLGGYVMMFGENAEDIAEDGTKSSDPRAYHNKSVWARMQIITAGVIMNLLLGLACFTFVYARGVTVTPAKLGGVLAGSPAYKAGLRAGDEIIAIDGRRDASFQDLLNRVSMSGAGQVIKFTVRRPGAPGELVFPIEPLRDASNQAPTIGVLMAHGLQLHPDEAFRAMPGQEVAKARPTLGFEGDDRVVAVGPEGGALEAVVDPVVLDRTLAGLRNQPVVVEVERRPKEAEEDVAPARVRVIVPPHRFLDFGLRLSPGAVAAVRPESPALKAGLMPGDRIEKVDGDADYDPMRLPDYAEAHRGKPVVLAVVRSAGGKEERFDATITPDASPAWSEPIDSRLVPLDVPGFGLALAIEPRVQAVAEGSPAARAGLKAGETLRSIVLAPARSAVDDDKAKPKPVTIPLDEKVCGWPSAFGLIQQVPLESVELTTGRSAAPIKLMPEVVPSRFHPDRGLEFQSIRRKLPPLGLADAASRASEETVDAVFNVFKMFRGMAQRRIGNDAVGGVIPIAKIAYSAASAGWTPLVHILGMLSVGLAVLNFLPIPPLDGGQFTLLAIEKIRGRPLPESAQNRVMVAGLVFVLGLVVLINGRDLFKLIQGYLP